MIREKNMLIIKLLKMNDSQQTTPLLPNNSESHHKDGYIDEDSKKSMAIVNLQAMLSDENRDIEIDQIITLLETNDWDEQQAAAAFYA